MLGIEVILRYWATVLWRRCELLAMAMGFVASLLDTSRRLSLGVLWNNEEQHPPEKESLAATVDANVKSFGDGLEFLANLLDDAEKANTYYRCQLVECTIRGGLRAPPQDQTSSEVIFRAISSCL